MTLVFGLLESALYGRKGDRGGPSVYFIRFLFFSFWLGQITPYSFELGFKTFDSINLPFAWRYSQELGDSIRCVLVINVMVNYPCMWSNCFGTWCFRG